MVKTHPKPRVDIAIKNFQLQIKVASCEIVFAKIL